MSPSISGGWDENDPILLVLGSAGVVHREKNQKGQVSVQGRGETDPHQASAITAFSTAAPKPLVC